MTRGRIAPTGIVGLVAALLMLTTGCASIPSSSRPQVIPASVPASPQADVDDLRYDELVPRDGERPEDIVGDYLRAAGSYERSHARARAYLTQSGNENWGDAKGATILENAPYLDVRNGGAAVQMTAQQRGRLEPDGSYVPGEAAFPYTFRLTKVDGNWRIENPPSGLLLESSTFDAAYRPYEIYFLNSTRTRVVPDVRWYAAARDTLPSLLVTALEQGPSQWLDGGVLTDLEGVTLQNNVEQVPDRVKVYLTGLDEQTETLTAGAFAQLVWTLNQVGVGGVEVYSEGRLLAPKDQPKRTLQQLNDWRAYSPDGPFVSVGYFIRAGAVWTTKEVPVTGPAGRSSFKAVSVAVSADEKAMAVVTSPGRGKQTLYVGAPAGLRRTVNGSSLTRPTWAGTQEVWTVRDGDEVLLVPLNGQTTRVDVPGLGSLGTIRALRLSRDGVRVAVVAGSPGRERLWVGVVIRENGAVQIDVLRPLDIGESPVSDVSWADSLNVVALVRGDRQDSSLYAVDTSGVSSGRLVTTTGLPGPPTAVAAGPALPLLTVAAGSLWRTPATDEAWSRATDRAGVSAPTYPG